MACVRVCVQSEWGGASVGVCADVAAGLQADEEVPEGGRDLLMGILG